MNTPTEIFFVISSIGFVSLWILMAIILVYILRAFHTLERILKRIERDINTIGDTSKEMLENLQGSAVYRFLFGRKKSKK